MNGSYFFTAILFVSVIVSAFSQILLKKEALVQHKNIVAEYLNARVIVAYAMFFCAVLLDLVALKKVPVSFVPVVESSSYFFVMILSRIFFAEKFTTRKLISLGVIFLGILIFII